MPVSRVTIIKAGTIRCEAHEEATGQLIALKDWCGVGGGSTVTYIESDRRILVDTGFDFEMRSDRESRIQNEKNLLRDLDSHGLHPDDIECIVLTHQHLDHTGNLGLFPHAEVIAGHQPFPFSRRGYTMVQNGDTIADGVSVFGTPGHTSDHISLLVEVEAFHKPGRISPDGIHRTRVPVTIGVAGDAIVTAGYYQMGKVWSYNTGFHSEKEAIGSMNNLVDRCDYIIPGHGVIFQP